jgi:hypothetical protein
VNKQPHADLAAMQNDKARAVAAALSQLRYALGDKLAGAAFGCFRDNDRVGARDYIDLETPSLDRPRGARRADAMVVTVPLKT